ncbi:Uncharacterised protein [Escherichia coli]|nr:Uncharacterised protein [Escherichia coli]
MDSLEIALSNYLCIYPPLVSIRLFFIINPNNSIQNESNPYLVNMTAKLIDFLYNQRCIFFTVLNK